MSPQKEEKKCENEKFKLNLSLFPGSVRKGLNTSSVFSCRRFSGSSHLQRPTYNPVEHLMELFAITFFEGFVTNYRQSPKYASYLLNMGAEARN